MEDIAAVVNEKLDDLIGAARGQVGEEGGATGHGERSRGHHISGAVTGHLIINENANNTSTPERSCCS